MRGFVFYPEGSAVWPQCWLCAVCAVSRVGCCVWGGGPCGGKHIINAYATHSLLILEEQVRRLPLYTCAHLQYDHKMSSRKAHVQHIVYRCWKNPFEGCYCIHVWGKTLGAMRTRRNRRSGDRIV